MSTTTLEKKYQTVEKVFAFEKGTFNSKKMQGENMKIRKDYSTSFISQFLNTFFRKEVKLK